MQLELTNYVCPAYLVPLLAADCAGYSTQVSIPQIKFWQEAELFELETSRYSNLLSLVGSTYELVGVVAKPGEYTKRGDTLSIWPIGYSLPLKLSFFGEEFETAKFYDPATLMNSDLQPKTLIFSRYKSSQSIELQSTHINIHSDSKQVMLFSVLPFDDKLLPVKLIDLQMPKLYLQNWTDLTEQLKVWGQQKFKIGVLSRYPFDLPQQLQSFLLTHEGVFGGYSISELAKLPAGFVAAKDKFVLLTDRELFGSIHLSSRDGDSSSEQVLRSIDGEIKPGDYIVHDDYGVGIYRGLTSETNSDGIQSDFLLVNYAKNDQVYVPINQLSKLNKFIGENPKLSSLSRGDWSKHKKHVKQSIGIMARQLVKHYAKRLVASAKPIGEINTANFDNFCAKFPFALTNEQSRALNEILHDLQQNKPMNRLLVGDVGFGKTEVFLRAVFKVCEQGDQIAILCPTTVLALQHYELIRQRFAGTDKEVILLSRAVSGKEIRSQLTELAEGKVAIVVGTHRLISSDVKFKSLGLMVVDEEQRFGVRQKEKFRQFDYGAHLLTVSATPIPRTLSMALSNISDISFIAEPPAGRKPIHTEIIPFDEKHLAEAINTELNRGGQVYFLHNDVATQPAIKARLQNILPGVHFQIAHGQMNPSLLTKHIRDFYERKSQVLIASTIIENGIDMPNVNTIIVNKAQHFGLSQLHQLRGRVGRSERDAYCYLVYQQNNQLTEEEKEKLNPTARKQLERFKTMLENADLGSGMRIASKDLELRGGGNVLGKEQSGHINSVGYTLYMQMLGEEIKKLKSLLSEPDTSVLI